MMNGWVGANYHSHYQSQEMKDKKIILDYSILVLFRELLEDGMIGLINNKWWLFCDSPSVKTHRRVYQASSLSRVSLNCSNFPGTDTYEQ